MHPLRQVRPVLPDARTDAGISHLTPVVFKDLPEPHCLKKIGDYAALAVARQTENERACRL